jgi:tetratricopeptide (TPR) repeat protein
MMNEHLLPDEVIELAAGRLSADRRLVLLEHLLRRCIECAGALARYGGLGTAASIASEEYDGAVSRAVARASRLAAQRQQAAAILGALLAGDRGWQELSPGEIALLRGLPRVQALLQMVPTLRHEDPQAMLAFAKLAQCAADQLDMRELGRRPVADLRALAWAELASAYRVCNELDRATRAMNRAVYWCDRGSRSPALLLRVADLLASLLAYQRRFPEGRALLRLVHRHHLAAGDAHMAGRALISQGNLAAWEGSPETAIPLMHRGFELLDQERDPQLTVQALWNMVWTLAEAGRFRTARRLLWRCRVVFTGVIDAHRLRWMEARILAGLGDAGRAEPAFRQAREAFAARGQVYPAALVGLDLAAMLARAGRVEDVHALAEEMIATFRALRIAREAVATLLVLQRACRTGGQVLEVIEIAVTFLRDLERQPARPVGGGAPGSAGGGDAAGAPPEAGPRH